LFILHTWSSPPSLARSPTVSRILSACDHRLLDRRSFFFWPFPFFAHKVPFGTTPMATLQNRLRAFSLLLPLFFFCSIEGVVSEKLPRPKQTRHVPPSPPPLSGAFHGNFLRFDFGRLRRSLLKKSFLILAPLCCHFYTIEHRSCPSSAAEWICHFVCSPLSSQGPFKHLRRFFICGTLRLIPPTCCGRRF